jgi:hypothetical protein
MTSRRTTSPDSKFFFFYFSCHELVYNITRQKIVNISMLFKKIPKTLSSREKIEEHKDYASN